MTVDDASHSSSAVRELQQKVRSQQSELTKLQEELRARDKIIMELTAQIAGNGSAAQPPAVPSLAPVGVETKPEGTNLLPSVSASCI